MTNGKDSAFPVETDPICIMDECGELQATVGVVRGGLTKRELFAAMAMQGFISGMTIGRAEYKRVAVETAVEYADALIAALSKKDGEQNDAE